MLASSLLAAPLRVSMCIAPTALATLTSPLFNKGVGSIQFKTQEEKYAHCGLVLVFAVAEKNFMHCGLVFCCGAACCPSHCIQWDDDTCPHYLHLALRCAID